MEDISGGFSSNIKSQQYNIQSLQGISDSVEARTPPYSTISPAPSVYARRFQPQVPNKYNPSNYIQSSSEQQQHPSIKPFSLEGASEVKKRGGMLFANEPDNSFLISSAQSAQKEASVTAIQILPKEVSSMMLLSDTTPIECSDIVTLLRILGYAYQNLSMYRCNEAIKMFKRLPKKQQNTGWVYSQLGRCYFENNKYNEANEIYEKCLKIEPYRLEGLEYYSTCLWHLKKQVELCYLSNFALERCMFVPETWCVIGNFYSLQKEHETALKFFTRAIQLNPNFAYAHTLSGHEYVSNEDFEHAKKCYQKALTADDKHYNAWWGLGNIFLKQEKYAEAAQYFKSAIKINGRSSVLYTYLGMTLHNNSMLEDALKCFKNAEEMDNLNPLNKYQKATVLVTLERYQEALKVLEELMTVVPKEAPIHIMIGKIYKKLGNVQKALHHFTIALDLDPKDNNMVKSLVDKLHMEVDINEEAEL